MGTRERPRDRGVARARTIVAASGQEIRNARRAAGLSLRAASAGVGMSYATFSRIERGLLPNVSVAQLAVATAAVGLTLSSRAFPDGDPIRDRAQLRLVAKLRAIVPREIPLRTEVPLPIVGDRRAIDAATRLNGVSIAFEAESRIADVQALERRLLRKQRDGGYDVLVLLVADTRANRLTLEIHREGLRANFSLDSRGVLASLRRGQAPSANGILIL
jgi:transcriptional regulator with XRE-family HTH domain